MFERMEMKSILETNIPNEVDVQVNHDIKERACNSEFNDRLKGKMAEFNEGLATLGDGISRLKTKLLSLEYRPPDSNSIDVQMCQNIHRNFRRILQKESRFLRDELFIAKEAIYKLEKKSCSMRSESINQSDKMVPYNSFDYHPFNFINVENDTQYWIAPHFDGTTSYRTYSSLPERFYYYPELMTSVPPTYESYVNERNAISQGSVCHNTENVSGSFQQRVPPQLHYTDINSEYKEILSRKKN